MSEVKKYSRYIDAKNRLLIVLAQWYKVVNDKHIPTTIDLLIVKEERVIECLSSDFEDWIIKKRLTKIN